MCSGLAPRYSRLTPKVPSRQARQRAEVQRGKKGRLGFLFQACLGVLLFPFVLQPCCQASMRPLSPGLLSLSSLLLY